MSEATTSMGVAVVGCGTVGTATCGLLTDDRALLAARSGVDLALRHIVDQDFVRARAMGLDGSLFRGDLHEALDDERTGVVVELVGGTTAAAEIIARSLRAGKHVVTANKALLAEQGTELYALARDHGVCIAFEASCAGGIPILRALTDGLVANRIDALYGIVNGTCNYILTEMTQKGQTFADALADAQRDGLAEADPSLDVGGGDSAHKLAILAALAFARRVELAALPVQGIDQLELCDLQYGRELGYVVKLLAIAQKRPDGLALRVRPAFIHMDHPLAWVSGPFNAVSVYGHAVGHTMFYGRGAGGKPTASAVVSDIVSVALGTAPAAFAKLPIWPDQTPPADQLPIDDVESRYYLRVVCEDRPGVLARIATVLGQYDISISSVLQHEPPASPAEGVPVVITTARAREGALRNALDEVDALQVVKARSTCLGIVDEHEEAL